jgi:hypothetical protein
VLNADKGQIQPSEMLRLNTSIKPTAEPNRLGVLGGDLQGFPNGRRLGDDVIDISIQAVEGAAQTGTLVEALAAGDKVDANDVEFLPQFPYLALPGNVTAADALGAPAKLSSQGTPGPENTLGAEGSGATGGAGAEATEAQVQPTAASSSLMNDLQALWLAGGFGAAVFAGALAMWFRRRRATVRANRAAFARGGSEDEAG